MPTINPSLVPFIPPGSLFDRFVSDSTINIRFYTPEDPATYSVLNRPLADIALRQLVIAKTLDQIDTNIGFLSQFPFVNQPRVENGSQAVDAPVRLFWDMHVSLPDKWGKVRLARVDRLNGTNGSTYTGTLRFIFSANEITDGVASATETAVFYADYVIDSTLTYQLARITAATAITGFTATVASGESQSIGGSIIFRTGDTSETTISQFLDAVAPGAGPYWIVSTAGTDTSEDFSNEALAHGTGLLAVSALNSMTSLESDPVNWVDSINYPFDLDATRTGSDAAVTIPPGLFMEFNITAPAGDNPTGDTSGTYYPVWVSRVDRTGDNMVFTFATYSTSDTAPSTTAVEFAQLTLQRNMSGGQKVAIVSMDNVMGVTTASGRTDGQVALFNQHFGRGHVVLSRRWDVSGGTVDSFFNAIPEIPSSTNSVNFNQSATRISAYAISRVPKYIPTKGQSQALVGTYGDPSTANRYVTEGDEGLGTQVDLEAQPGITSNAAISRYGNMGTRIRKLVKLIVNPSAMGSSATFYDDEILPRLRILLGRNPVAGDIWMTGSTILTFNGESWQS